MMFCAKRDACSAAVQAPSDWRTGMMSLSMVLGSPTTVSEWPLLARNAARSAAWCWCHRRRWCAGCRPRQPSAGQPRPAAGSPSDQATLHQVGGIGELDPRVPDGGSAEAVEECGILPNRGRHRDRVALQKALIAISVSDDLNLGATSYSARSARRSPRRGTVRHRPR